MSETARRLDLYASTERDYGFTFWAVVNRETGALIGDCGLAPREWRGPEIEVGYRIARSHWGRGLATEATLASLEAGFEHFDLPEIFGRTKRRNTPSRRVMEKAGMEYVGLPRLGGSRWAMYRATREGWEGGARHARHAVGGSRYGATRMEPGRLD